MTNTENVQSEIPVINAENTEKKKRERAAYLSKWILGLFWLDIPLELVKVLLTIVSESGLTWLKNILFVIQLSLYVPFLLVYFNLAKKEKAFVPTAVSVLIGAIFSAAIYILAAFEQLGLAAALFVLAFYITVPTEAYLEIKAFRKTLIGVNDRLSRGWKHYWWVYLGLFFAQIRSDVIGMFSETFSQISKAGWAFIGFVESIVLTIMIYRTAIAFKRVAQGDEESLLR